MKSPLHILIGNNIYPPIMAGGAELIVKYLAEGLAAKGHRVTVVSTCGPEMEPYADEHTNGVEVLRFFPKNLYWHWTRGDKPAHQKALWHLRDAWNTDTSKRLKEILATRKPDILHTHLIDGFSAAIWKTAQSHGMKVIHTAHDYHLLCPRSVMLSKDLNICTKPKLGCRLFKKWHLGTTKHVDLFCSPSKFLIEKHIEQGLQVANTQVVANGIPLPKLEKKPSPTGTRADIYVGGEGSSSTTDSSKALTPALSPPFSLWEREKKGEREPIRFLFAARHTREKGCEVLIEAISRIPKEVNAEFWIAGKGELEPQFQALAAKDKRVTLLGFISGEQKEQLFKQADCMIIPSLWYENAPVVIVEAAAYGMGIIGSDIGAIPEFISHEKTGLLFEPGNGQALAAAMQRIVSNPELLSHFAHHAQRLIEASSVERMVDNYEAQYRMLLA